MKMHGRTCKELIIISRIHYLGLEAWSDTSMVMSTGWSPRWTGFHSQYSHGGSLSIFTRSSGHHGHQAWIWCTDIHTVKTCRHEKMKECISLHYFLMCSYKHHSIYIQDRQRQHNSNTKLWSTKEWENIFR